MATQFVGECIIGSDWGERIDLVDQHEKVAYELKASSNNTHMEFYRDIFKTWVQREIGDEPLKKLVFITPETGARRLQAGFGQQVIRLAQQHGLAIRNRSDLKRHVKCSNFFGGHSTETFLASKIPSVARRKISIRHSAPNRWAEDCLCQGKTR